ncbi:MAG: CHAT domain-containing protein [Thermoanaerobaculia bacterium]
MSNVKGINITGGTGVNIGDYNQIVTEVERSTPVEAPEPVRVLFLAANPEGTAALRLDQEVKAIDEALRCSRSGPRFELQQSWAVGDKELQDSLLRWQPDIVHLSGHGSREGRLMLEGTATFRDLGSPGRQAAQRGEDPQVQALARVFAAARGRIRCVVLNACHSEAVARALAQQVGCVIGMSQSVTDAAAIRFSWAFYNALGYGLTVKMAFEMGTAQMGLAVGGQEEVPRLLAAGVDPAEISFS